ncbi:MAG: putative MPP superfamily phosphohydrolase [Candidatus Omnitrophota bacterium]|jgi:predicted MPP superfamily phosphohydrolase
MSIPDLHQADDPYARYEEAVLEFYKGLPRAPTDLSVLESRIGRSALISRLQKQLAYREYWKGKGHGMLKFGPMIDRLKLIPLVLKTTGLWNRGVRNALDVQVIEHELVLHDLPEALDGYRMLHASDLHLEFHPDFAERLAAVIAPLKVDIALVTGDFRYMTYGPHEAAIEAMQTIMPAFSSPVFGILGNHDPIELLQPLEAMGMTMLMNEGLRVGEGERSYYLAGVDDPHYYRADDLAKASADAGEGFRLLLSHSTEIYAEAEALGYHLMLSGHTHGGQICLPAGMLQLNNARSPRDMVHGSWAHDRLQGYTSSGAGCVAVPIRFNCPAEVVVHTLRRARS